LETGFIFYRTVCVFIILIGVRILLPIVYQSFGFGSFDTELFVFFSILVV